MAVAMDLGNPYSPYRSSYPTDKKDVAIRLAQAGLVIAYGKQGYYTGPLVSEIRVKKRKTLEIVYKPNSVRVRIEVRRRKKYPAIGFEVRV